MPRETYSLRDRLLLTASLTLFVFLGLMGLVLDQAFQRSAEENVSERLLVQIYGLLSVMEVENKELFLPEVLQEPRFNNPGSGLFSIVLDENGEELWQSPSTVDLYLDADETVELYAGLEAGVDRFGKVEQSGQGQYFYLSYKILWQGSAIQSTPYTFVVIESTASFDSTISKYRNSLWGWLVAVVGVLIFIQGVVMKWGLSPLQKLASDLKAIEDGNQDYLDGDYPAEIAGVTKNLNLLLTSERQQREKYRTTLADLAHSLKTPLAILKGSASQLEYRKSLLLHDDNPGDNSDPGGLAEIQQTIDEQVARMDQIVGYQLERAVADSSTLIKKSIAVAPVVEKLIAALKKVYVSKEVDIDLTLNDCNFFGDERDLMEVLGNIIDNACKYGKHKIRVDVGRHSGMDLVFVVEDDGAGIDASNRQSILNRGMRLDTKEAGQGIGLAIVVEIVDRYSGTIEIDESILGGAKVTVGFP